MRGTLVIDYAAHMGKIGGPSGEVYTEVPITRFPIYQRSFSQASALRIYTRIDMVAV